MNQTHTSRDVTQCFFLGLLAGGAAAILFAPSAGALTRRRIREAVQTGAGAAAKGIRQKAIATRNRTSGLMEDCRATVSQEKLRITSALDAARNAYLRAASD